MRSDLPLRPKGNVKQLKTIFSYLKPYRGRIALASIAIIFTSTAVLGLGSGLRYLIDEGLSKHNQQLLNQAFALLLGVTLLLAGATYTRFYLVSTIGEQVVADIRKDIYRHLMRMHVGYFEVTRTGELLSRLTTDTTLLQTVIGSSLSIAVRNILMCLGGLILLFVTSTKLSLYLLLVIPFIVTPIMLLGRRMRTLARDSQAKVAEISGHAEESINSIRAIQALTLEDYDATRYNARVDEAFSAARSRIAARARLTAIVILLIFGSIVTVLWAGGHDVMSGTISAGDLSAFVFYSVVVAGAVGAISEVFSDIQRAAGAAERINELLSLQTEIYDTSRPHELAATAPIAVTFTQVNFTYPARPNKLALADFSLTVKPGETIALVGPSGAGKTTLFQLLLRFYQPDSGQITFGALNIDELPLKYLRGAIGLVPQDPVIFSTTVAENIALGRPEASLDEITQAAKLASALQFIETLSEGMQTHLGEKGVRLSGGQRQRIAIARAVIRKPSLLLLDEATSALDSENEQLIQAALEAIAEHTTTFIIAHRLSTVKKADRIVLLNEGKIEAIGTHEELIARSVLYRRLAELQFAH